MVLCFMFRENGIKNITNHNHLCSVQVHQQGQEDQHHRLHVANAGTVLFQPGGADQGADGGAGGGETEDREAPLRDAPAVSHCSPHLS